jgi:hypothetical protein
MRSSPASLSFACIRLSLTFGQHPARMYFVWLTAFCFTCTGGIAFRTPCGKLEVTLVSDPAAPPSETLHLPHPSRRRRFMRGAAAITAAQRGE